MNIRRLLPVIIILIGMAIAYYFGAGKLISIDRLNEIKVISQNYVNEHSVWSPLLFIGIYYLYAALALPGAFILTLISGCIFPLPLSTIYVLIADTLGSCTLFLSARAAFGDDFYMKAGPFLMKMEKGFKKNATGYMLLFRLIPVFPFWIINVAPAFFGIRFTTFLWTTIVGLIPENLILTVFAASFMAALEKSAS
jgi:uncharacterized membrane protein YdjX (TVP38/TMEM64 family)